MTEMNDKLWNEIEKLRREVERLRTLEGGGGIIPSCRVYNNAHISIPNNVYTVLTFNSERWDTDDIHSTVTNTGRLTCKTAGLYAIYGHVQFASSSTGNRFVRIRWNLARYICSQKLLGNNNDFSIVTHYVMAVGEYVELMVYQNSGGALNVDAALNYSPEFGMTYLGKAA